MTTPATFRTKLFLAALCRGAHRAASWRACCSPRRCAGATDARIEETLVGRGAAGGGAADPRRRRSSPCRELDAEADRLGAIVGARVTFIARRRPRGRRFGRDARGRRGRWRTTGSGPEVVEARAARPRPGRGATATRSASTCCTSPCRSPTRRSRSSASRCRSTDVRQQLQTVRARDARWRSASRSSAPPASPGSSRARIGRRVRAIADVARALPQRRSDAAAPRLRRRRARHRGAGARRLGAGARTAAGRAGARSRAHGSDPRRHGRRRHRGRSAGPAAAGQRRGAADAAARRR